jgi:hypothetical protein
MTDSSFSSAPHFDSRSIKEKDYSRKKEARIIGKITDLAVSMPGL